ncbi:hypothetical protein CGCSCA4_v000614 [Colletotrichum siamense]|uniref:Uncharacterized protein n=1 Tax=Colletotrichum siamense TaxID=690259 RepID=A0A9P5EUQ6_COLSI|nr:hypothetical protein CGCSCA4_v000614 [Colletotrichum siamense]KAF4860397.1 hypothetical protein CGCSCA2_v005218 [Colletotrichum siamense]
MSTPKIGPITTYTFVTTAKNPSVVYSPISTPRYGHDPETKAPQDKHTAVKPADKPTDNPQQPAPNDQRPPDSPTSQPQLPPNDQRPPASTVPPRESVKEPPKATYTITVEPTKVIVNDQTFTVTNPSETRQVSVSGAEFTINPSEVVGGGTIVDRPGNVGRSTVAPSSTVVGDVPVVVAPDSLQNVVVVGGTTFELQATPVVAVVQGQTITIQSSGIVFPKQTVSINRSSPTQTEIVVAGGEMVTAIGPSVVIVHSTTFTYGLASSTITEIVDDDTILIGPSGVIVRNVTMGGPNAKASDTAFEIVGGATITQVGASVVVVEGKTFTVGPGRGTTTTVIGGETITIGPSGVAVSTLSLRYPFGPTVVTTIRAPTATAPSAPAPSETKTNGGPGVRHAKRTAGPRLEFCIAIGVWVLGRLV